MSDTADVLKISLSTEEFYAGAIRELSFGSLCFVGPKEKAITLPKGIRKYALTGEKFTNRTDATNFFVYLSTSQHLQAFADDSYIVNRIANNPVIAASLNIFCPIPFISRIAELFYTGQYMPLLHIENGEFILMSGLKW